MASYDLPTSPYTAVWRLIKTRLKEDIVFQDANVTLLFFEGDRDVTTDTDSLPRPSIVFLASQGRMSWFSAASQSGALIVSYQVVVGTIDDEDMLNLQSALATALYPNDNNVFHQSLIDAVEPHSAAVTGQPLFMQPTTTSMMAAGKAGMLQPTGQFVVEVEQRFAP
jgi:hypothetical protein